MEGPSLFLAQEQLKPFKKQVVQAASGNTKTIIPGDLTGLPVTDLFSWGKHLVLQFPDFALRIHFMLFGTFEAEVEGHSVTGDYKRAREPRLALTFENGQFLAFNCSIKVIESRQAKKEYDFTRDIMHKNWGAAGALKLMRATPDEQIADVLLDQDIFAGVGNIIKNEVLSITKVAPQHKIGDLAPKKLREIIDETRAFSLQFYKWRKKFVLRKNLKVHGRGTCPHCGNKLIKQKTGKRERWAYWCPIDQPY
ncbi:MAG TPA: endonuclease [Candidatus Paceibacterota bacterium]|jgi:endonuclease-8